MNYNKKQILDYIKAIEHLSLFLKELLEQENKLSPEPVTITDKIKETASLKLMCKKGNWPEAIPEEYICGEDYDSRMFRAYGIIEQYLQSVDLTQKKFLDFGCGDGLVAEIALKFGAEVSVGYDIKPDDLWDKIEKKDNLIVTNNLDDLIGYKFDLILLNNSTNITSLIDVKSDKSQLKEVDSNSWISCSYVTNDTISFRFLLPKSINQFRVKNRLFYENSVFKPIDSIVLFGALFDTLTYSYLLKSFNDNQTHKFIFDITTCQGNQEFYNSLEVNMLQFEEDVFISDSIISCQNDSIDRKSVV
jgi:SAM-dependent methyltransferase